MGKHWTKQDDNKLRAMFNTGLSEREIAKELQRTENSIGSRISSLRILGFIKLRRKKLKYLNEGEKDEKR